MRQTTRIVEEISPTDLLLCSGCNSWLAAERNYNVASARPKQNHRPSYLHVCKPCGTRGRTLRRQHPDWDWPRIRAEIRKQAVIPTLKGAGHKRSAPRKPQTAREKNAWKVIREERKKRSGRGYIYLIAEKPGVPRTVADPVKVGYSDDPEGRPAGLQTGNSRKLHLLGFFPGTEADERKLHARYIKQNILGEWFRPTDELLSEFGLTRGDS